VKGQERRAPREGLRVRETDRLADRPLPVVEHSAGDAREELAVSIAIEVQGQRKLPQIVRTPRAPGRFARGLDRRQQQRDQYADDGDQGQDLDERETM
jgi:hypothetical protein